MTEVDETPAAVTRPPERRGDEGYAGIAAAAIAVAMVCLLIGALIGALAIDLGSGPDVWKARVRLMSVSRSGLYGGVLIALGLLVALSLARRATNMAVVLTAVVGASVWLGLLMVLNIYVDITSIYPADIALATALGDIAAVVMLVAAGVWGFTLAGSKRR